jgi:hypothetical protein
VLYEVHSHGQCSATSLAFAKRHYMKFKDVCRLQLSMAIETPRAQWAVSEQDRQHASEARSRYHCCRGKTISIKYYKCVSCILALVIQQRGASLLRRIILPSVTCQTLPYFSTLSHERHDLRRKKLLNIKCMIWFPLQLLSETFLILRRIQWDTIINVHRSSGKVPVILVRF